VEGVLELGWEGSASWWKRVLELVGRVSELVEESAAGGKGVKLVEEVSRAMSSGHILCRHMYFFDSVITAITPENRHTHPLFRVFSFTHF
jgi:hypothetical protein